MTIVDIALLFGIGLVAGVVLAFISEFLDVLANSVIGMLIIFGAVTLVTWLVLGFDIIRALVMSTGATIGMAIIFRSIKETASNKRKIKYL